MNAPEGRPRRLPEPLVQTYHDDPAVLLDSHHRPWLVIRAEQRTRRNGKMPVPRQCREWLQQIAESGLTFHAIVLAHELDPDQVHPAMIGHTCSQQLAQQLIGRAPANPVVFGVVGKDGPPKDDEPAWFFPLVAWRW
jgi:hypothetical protein